MLTLILSSLVLTVTVKMVLDCVFSEDHEDEGRITRRRSSR
jgi:hypothetical protein